MSEQPLHQQLGIFLSELDQLRQSHEDAQNYMVAVERLAFVLERVRLLQNGLVNLRAVSQRLADAGDPTGSEVWSCTREELRRLAPDDPWLSTAALRLASLDLLRLVEYTGAAACLLAERRAVLERRLVERAMAGTDQVPASDGSSCGALAD
ncbi:MAG: hypothetical protein OHK0022_19220 [Roseiflexaceae bacterium]